MRIIAEDDDNNDDDEIDGHRDLFIISYVLTLFHNKSRVPK